MKVSTATFFSGYPIGSVKRVEPQVEKGLNFILRHLEEPYWPRNISTKLTGNRQITVYSKLEALSYFKDANYLDCRVSAYAPDSKRLCLVMIDLDLENFKSKREFNKAHVEILSNIYRAFGKCRKSSISPVTVLFTGNGNHYLVPLKPISANKANCKEFLQFIEKYLSNGKCDEQHNKVTSLKNCLLRIPGSINSDGMAQVKILEKWDGESKLDLSPLYQKFQHDNYRRLAKKVVKPHTIFSQNSRLARQVKLLEQFCQQKTRNNGKHDNDFIPWIERLLKTPIPDHRKYCIWRILAPYLINVKHLSFEDCLEKRERDKEKRRE
jgi:hypothetical protein